MNIDTKLLVSIALEAGKIIYEIYKNDSIDIELKLDESPLTIADKKANQYICNTLQKYYPNIPIISEENKNLPFDTRSNWKYCFIVDPLDGTKEFIKKSDEFTVNIAFVENGKPIEGVIYAPAIDVVYYTENGKSYKKANGDTYLLPLENITKESYTIVASKSHMNDETKVIIEEKKKEYPNLVLKSIGSSLKLCLVAEGSADFYPRLAPTMEWDTAAAHAIVLQAGKNVYDFNSLKPLDYNKNNLLNPKFVVK